MSRRRRDVAPASASGTGARLVPIGVVACLLAAIALFFGLRAPETERGETPAADEDRVAGAPSAAPSVPALGTATDRPAGKADDTADVPVAAATDAPPAAPEPPGTEDPAPADGSDGGGLAGSGEPAPGAETGPDDDAARDTERAAVGDSPSVEDPEVVDLFGSRIVMVSAAAPRVILLADGTRLVPGERLFSGHRLVDIEHERIRLERDGVERGVRIP